MLAVFADAADRVGVAYEEVQGSWPAVAPTPSSGGTTNPVGA